MTRHVNLYILVHVAAVLCKTTTCNDQSKGFFEERGHTTVTSSFSWNNHAVE